ncbi:MAG: hypothetical protein H0U34_08805 [Sphingomonas sp.]|nr:hypothetical protein [Sphingomonas sp.]
MRNNITAAVFNDRDQAEKAIHELRDSGVPDSAISVIKLHDDSEHDDDVNRTTADDGDDKASGTTKGLIAGGSVGAIAGLGALLIPGIGPFIAGGALVETLGVAGSAAVASGAVGATAGGLTGALVDYGVDREHADHYEKKIREGAVFVAVDTSNNPSAFDASRGILRAAGGESAESHQESNA